MKAYTHEKDNETLRIYDPYLPATMRVTHDGHEFVWAQVNSSDITTMFGRGDREQMIMMCGFDDTDMNVIDALWPPKKDS